ncbi:metal ABC transporter solute-binding protein, Zn/Mn family [Silvimonas iriomotensis]|uniref:Metal ABC transporter substrate-binding protein n=1 Tax=Silvimonas iriomotensis TaxID=449662 RepID=A0ABQ2PCH3_9NEIS|nr:zinc ABC transporter substrate-binding protein [Silvimonas iriomotensis]GGP23239.1 metal ABC transporter substrate-binding protein [Silvimonas iriomotensis]
MPRLFRSLALLCLMALSGLAGAADRLPVAVSFSVLGDLVRQVGGERITTVQLVGPDEDAHVYQPTPGAIADVSRTKLFFVNGLGLEGWLTRLQQAASYKGQVITVNQGGEALTMTEDGKRVTDPHTWQDPARVKGMVEVITKALASADPAGSAYYRQRADAYQKQLDDLASWATTQFNTIPAGKRVILTSHDAFGYLGHRFGVKILAPQGVSTDAEPSAKEVGDLVRQIRSSGIRAVFMENISNPKMVQQIAAETGTTATARLYSDALSKDGSADTYLKMYRHNVTALVAGMKLNK